MKLWKSAFWSGAVALLCAGSAHAELLPGVTKTWPDITLGFGSIYYDHDGTSASQGLLRLVASNATLTLASAGANVTQTYSSGPDLALSIVVDNTTGAFVSGTVDISLAPNASQPRFSWTGTVTNFGFAADGKTFNATWQFASDQYQNLSPSFAALSNGVLSSMLGGLILSNSSGFSGAGFSHTATGQQNFGIDWIMGAVNNNLTAYKTGMTSPITVTAATTADVFVPIPAGVWLLASGLGLLTQQRRIASKRTH